MILKAVIAMKTNDTPKIVLGSEIEGSHQVTFDLYGIDPTALLSLVNQELQIDIKAIGDVKETHESGSTGRSESTTEEEVS